MIPFPAIDIKNGHCVRLEQGDPERLTRFNPNPLAQAKSFADIGFEWLHVVDLDAALGEGDNRAAIKKLVRESGMKVQLGGGIRQEAQAEQWLDLGVARVVIGTAAFRAPEWVEPFTRAHRGQVVLALDGKDGQVALAGWRDKAGESVPSAAKRFAGWGAAAFLYTDIARDGLLSGLDMQAQLALARASSVPVIVSGGFGGEEDLAKLKAAREEAGGENIAGVVVGRALYEGTLSPARLLQALASC